MTNPLFISSLLFAATSLALAIVVPFLGRKKVHRLWALFNFFVAWWGFGLVMICLSKNASDADFWSKCATAGGLMIPVLFCHFAVTFSERKSKWFLLFSYIQAPVVAFLYSTGRIKHQVVYLFNSFYYIRAVDSSYHLITLSWLSGVAYAHFVLLKALFKSTEDKKVQIRYLFAASLIGFITGGVTHFLTVYGFPVHPSWNVFITVYTLLASFAVFRHKLFDIDFAVRRSLVYSLLLSLTTGLYFLTLISMEKIFQKSLGYSSAISIGTVGVIILFVEPLRIRLQSLIDYLFFKGTVVTVSREKERLQTELQKQDQMKAVATFAAGMAHEVKNPLTAIKTFTEHLPEKHQDPEFIRKFCQVVGPEVEKIDSLVKQLLDFSKPSPLQLEALDIHGVLDETLDLLSGECVKRRIVVERRFKSSPSAIQGDKKQLKQAFLNIFLNSIQAMPDGGTLKVSTDTVNDRKPFSKRDQLLISVSDTGCGIPKESLSQIFDPFFTTKSDGTGLGLSIVQGIIKEHKGKIEVSSAPGQWTEFKITFNTMSI